MSKRNQARQDDLNKRVTADWPSNMTSSIPEHSDPTLGNAFSRMPKPSDVLVASKSDRFGSSADDDTDSSIGGAVQKNAAPKGVEPARKRG